MYNIMYKPVSNASEPTYVWYEISINLILCVGTPVFVDFLKCY